MNEDTRHGIHERPNWAYVLSCCAFAVPIGVAAVQLFHDTANMLVYPGLTLHAAISQFGISVIIHLVVIVVSASGFIIVASQWRRFYALSETMQWTVMLGCWLVVDVVGFKACLIIGWILNRLVP